MQAKHREARDYLSELVSGAVSKSAFIAAWAAALVAHGYRWANAMYSHDSLMIVETDTAHKIILGRYLQPLWWAIRGKVVPPYLVGLIGTLFLAVACVLIVRRLGIKSRALAALSSGVLSTCSVLTLTNATYVHEYDVMMLSLLLACAAACTVVGGWRGVALSSLLAALSAAFYQPFLEVAATLMVASLLLSCLDGWDPMRVVRRGVGCLAALGAGVILYYLGYKAAMWLTATVSSGAYNSVSSAGLPDDSLLSSLKNCLFMPFAYLSSPETHFQLVCGIAYLILIIGTIVCVIWALSSNRASRGITLLSLALLLVLPFAMNFEYLVTAGTMHGLMIFSFYLVVPIALAVYERATGRLHARSLRMVTYPVVCVLLGGLVFCNVVYANDVYVKKHLEEQSTLSLVTRLAMQMDTTEGYVPGKTPVVFIGKLGLNKLVTGARSGFGGASKGQLYRTGLWNDVAITGTGPLSQYFAYVLGEPLKVDWQASSDEGALKVKELRLSPFPSEDSCVLFEGKLYVRLS